MALDLFNSQTPEEVCSYLTELSARIKGKNARSLARALVRAANDYIHPVIASAAIFNEPRYEIIASGKSSQTLVALFLGQVGTNCRISDVRTVLMDVHKFLSKLRAPDTDPLTPNLPKGVCPKGVSGRAKGALPETPFGGLTPVWGLTPVLLNYPVRVLYKFFNYQLTIKRILDNYVEFSFY